MHAHATAGAVESTVRRCVDTSPACQRRWGGGLLDTRPSTRPCWGDRTPRRGRRSAYSTMIFDAMSTWIDRMSSDDTCVHTAAVSPAQLRSKRTHSMRPRGRSPVSSAARLHPQRSSTSKQLICAGSPHGSFADVQRSAAASPCRSGRLTTTGRPAAEGDATQPMHVEQRIGQHIAEQLTVAAACTPILGSHAASSGGGNIIERGCARRRGRWCAHPVAHEGDQFDALHCKHIKPRSFMMRSGALICDAA